MGAAGASAGLSAYRNAPPALREILETFGPPNLNVAPPYIPRKTKHYQFANLVRSGFSYEAACDEIDVSPRTVERWRKQLCDDAQAYFGRRLTYEFVARYVLDMDYYKVQRLEPQS